MYRTLLGGVLSLLLSLSTSAVQAQETPGTVLTSLERLMEENNSVFSVAGTQHPDRIKVIETLHAGDAIILHRAYGNVYDGLAIDVRDKDGRKFGHLTEKDCAILSPAWEEGVFSATIETVRQITDLPAGADRPVVSVRLSYTPGREPAPDLNSARVLRIGYPTADRDPYVALENNLGWFAEELSPLGVEVRMVGLKDGNDIIKAAADGNIDVSLGFGDTPFIEATAEQAPILTIARGKEVKGYFTVVTTASGPITHLADLKGRRVATVAGTKTYDFMLRVLAHEGLGLNDITYVATPDKDATLAALKDGSVEAIMMTEPMISRYVSDPSLRFISEGDQLKKDLNNMIASSAFAWKNPDIVARFLKAVLRYNEYIEQHRDETCTMVNDYFKTGYSLDRFVRHCSYEPRWTPALITEYEKARDVMLENGTLKQTFDISRFFNNYFMDLAQKK